MIQAIGNTLPIITAIMISPIPMVGLIVVITSKRGPAKAVAYGMGFFTAIWLTAFLLGEIGQDLIGGPGGAGRSSTLGGLIHAVVGAILLVVGSVVLVRHLRRTSPPTEPKWMRALDSASILPVFGLGCLLALVNPKNLPLIVSATVDYVQANLSTVQLAIAVTVLALIGSLLIFLPILLVHLARKRSARLCAKLRPWLVAHNATILAAVCLIVGAALLGKALASGVL